MSRSCSPSLVILVLTIQSSFFRPSRSRTITRLLVYATTCLALPIFRRRQDLPPAAFTVPFGVVAAMLSRVLIGWLLTNVDFAKEGLPILFAAAIGLIIFACSRLFVRFRCIKTCPTRERNDEKKGLFYYFLAVFAAGVFSQTIEDSSRRTIGYISSSGTVEDSSRRTLGYINDNGRSRTAAGELWAI